MLLTPTQINDLIISTHTYYNRGKLTNVSDNVQRYPLNSQFLKKNKRQVRGGPSITFNLAVDLPDTAEQVKMYQGDDVKTPKALDTFTVYWRHTRNHYAYEHREFLINQGKSRILNLIKNRMFMGRLANVKHMEEQAWGTPASSDDLEVLGLPLWIVKAVSGTSGGADDHGDFYGQNPNGWSTSPATEIDRSLAKWANVRNWAAIYRDVSKNDLIYKMRRAREYTNFESPIDTGSELGQAMANNLRYYCSMDLKLELEQRAEDQNDKLGFDLAAVDGKMTVRGNPIVSVPQFDSLTDGSGTSFTDDGRMYQINLESIWPYYLAGDFMRQTGPIRAGGDHNVWVVWTDTTWNIVCDNPRLNAVFSLSDEAGTVPAAA